MNLYFFRFRFVVNLLLSPVDVCINSVEQALNFLVCPFAIVFVDTS